MGMRIRMKTLISTPTYTAQPGQVIELPAKEAQRLIDRRYAVRADRDPAERAAKRAAEAKQAAAAEDDVDLERPEPTDRKSAWVAWVTGQYGFDRERAEKMTRRDLIALDEAGGEPGDEDGESDGEGDDPDDEDGEE